MFGADKQVPRRGRRHLTSVRPSLCRADGPNCTSIRFANLPRPKVEAGAFFHSWQRRTNLWRGRTNLRTGSERLRGVMRRLDPQALAFFGPGHPWWWHPRPRMLRSLLAQSSELLAWPSTLQCTGGTGEERASSWYGTVKGRQQESAFL